MSFSSSACLCEQVKNFLHYYTTFYNKYCIKYDIILIQKFIRSVLLDSMKSLEKFKDILKKYFNSELEEYSQESSILNNVILKSEIQIEEMKKKIIELSKNNDNTIDIFSPAEPGEKFISNEIVNLNKEVEKIEKELDNDKLKKSRVDNKVSEIEKLIKEIEVFQQSDNTLENVSEYIDKLEFCSKICISDNQRCKLELDKVIDKIKNNLDK